MHRLLTWVGVAFACVLPATSAEARKSSPPDTFTWDSLFAADWDSLTDSNLQHADAVVLFEKIEVNDQEAFDSKHFLTIYRRIRILSAEGRKWADVEVPFFHKDQKLLLVRGRVIQRSGDTLALDPQQVLEKQVFKSEKLKVKMQSFSVPGASGDCIIEYVIKLRMPTQYSRWTIQREIPVREGILRWHINTDTPDDWLSLFLYGAIRHPYYIAMNLGKPMTIERLPTLKEVTEIRFGVTNIPAYRIEEQTLPEKSLVGYVMLYYGGGRNPDAYWGMLSSSIPRYLGYFVENSKQIKTVARQLDTIPQQEEKIRAAYTWVQTHLRNLSYRSKTDTSKVLDEPETADEAIKKGIGSSDDICKIFCDLLRTMSIDAHLAFVVNRNEDLLVREAMFWQFDQTLVVVPDSIGNLTFFAPGELYMPYGRVPWYAEGISALIGASEGEVFSAVPTSAAADNKTTRIVNVTLTDDLSVTGSVTELKTGHAARQLRMECFDAPASGWPSLAKKQLEENLTAFEAESLQVENVVSTDGPLRMTCKVHTANPVADQVGQHLLFRPLDLLEQPTDPFTAGARENPVMFDYAWEVIESLQLTYPSGWAVEAVAPDTLFVNALGSCGLQISVFDSSVAIQRVFKLTSPFVPVADYRALQDLFAARATQAAATVSLVKTVN